MSWFKRKKDDVLIPPVASAPPSTSTSGPPSYRSNARTYVRSRDGDLDGGNSYGANYGASNSYGRMNRSQSDDAYGAPPSGGANYGGNDYWSSYSKDKRNLGSNEGHPRTCEDASRESRTSSQRFRRDPKTQ